MSKWPMVRLGDVCEVNPRTNVENLDIEVSFVPMSCISENGTLELLETRSFTEVKNGFTTFQDRDVIFAKITPCMENGKGAIVDRLCNGVGAGSTEFHVIRPDQSKVLSEWIFLFTKWDHFREEAKLNMTGSAGQKRVPKKFLSEHLLPLPPLETQKKIADVLDKAKSLIDLRKKQIEKMDLLIKSKFIEMFGDPVMNPKEWVLGTIRDIVSDVRYGTSSPSNEDGSYIYLRMNNITYDGHIDLSSIKHINVEDKDFEKYAAHKGDLLFNRTNSKELVGKAAVYKENLPVIIAGYIIRVRTNERANSEYLSAVLNSKYGKSTLYEMCKSIVGQSNINAQELQGIKVLIPPINLQNQFACFVDEVENQKKMLKRTHNKMEISYKSLMQEYFG